MNVLLIKSKTKLQYFVYIVSWKSTRRPTCNIDKTLKISLLRNLFVHKMTLQWKQTKKILTESKNQKTEIDASTEHPVITSWNQCLDSSTFFFLVCGCTRVKRHRKQRSGAKDLNGSDYPLSPWMQSVYGSQSTVSTDRRRAARLHVTHWQPRVAEVIDQQ